MAQPQPNLWVFHHGALGDSVLIWPLLRAMGSLTLVSSWSKARLAAKWIPGIEPADGESPEFSRLFTPSAALEISDALRNRLSGIDRIVSFISNGRDHWAENLRTIRSDRQLFCVTPRPPAEDWNQPIGLFHQRQLQDQHLAITPVMPPLRRNPDGPVLLHPGSGGRAKCWPAERFEHLAEYLHRIGRPYAIVIGPVERERMAAGRIEHWMHRYQVIAPPDFIELSEHIGRASVFVGNDSGPTQLAAQLGVPTLALFGPTSPVIWSPVGPAVRVLAPPTPREMDWLPVEMVIEAVARW